MKSPPINPMHGEEKKGIINESRKRERSNELTSQPFEKRQLLKMSPSDCHLSS